MRSALLATIILALSLPAAADDAAILGALEDLARTDSSPGSDKTPLTILDRQVDAALMAVNVRETRAWHKVASRREWEAFRDQRIDALRRSLGPFPPVPDDLHVRVTGRLDGNGYRVENIVFQSRPGLFVTANLYAPPEAAGSMPGILICHSHHLPKSEGELQDIVSRWAASSCCSADCLNPTSAPLPAMALSADIGLFWKVNSSTCLTT